MAYTAEISRINPSAFLFLIDQSGSMQDVLDPSNVQALDQPVSVDGRTYTHSASGRTKAQGVADAVNKLLQNLIIRCARPEVRPYFEVGVLGYGGDSSATRVGPAFGGVLGSRDLVPINEIADNPMRVEQRNKKVDDGAGGLVDQNVKFPIWFDAVASGGTPMCAALSRAHSTLSGWVAQHPTSFPPICINITDGQSTDGDPLPGSESLKSLSTSDGNILFFNLHFSSERGAAIEFPDSDVGLPDQFAKMLFNMSSLLPPHTQAIARKEGKQISEVSRGFAFNADLVSLIQFLNIGTQPSNLR